jgi:hypothetical protein
VVVLHGAACTGNGVIVLSGLETGYLICEYPYPNMSCERYESRVYGYYFRPHDDAGLFCPR